MFRILHAFNFYTTIKFMVRNSKSTYWMFDWLVIFLKVLYNLINNVCGCCNCDPFTGMNAGINPDYGLFLSILSRCSYLCKRNRYGCNIQKKCNSYKVQCLNLKNLIVIIFLQVSLTLTSLIGLPSYEYPTISSDTRSGLV